MVSHIVRRRELHWGVFRPEETRHNGLNGAADAEETEEAVLTEAGNHATTKSGGEDTDDETYVPENNPVIDSRVTKSNDTSLQRRVGLSKHHTAPQLLQSVNQETNNNTLLGQRQHWKLKMITRTGLLVGLRAACCGTSAGSTSKRSS